MVALTPPPVSAPLIIVKTNKKKMSDGSTDIDVQTTLNPIWATWFTNVFTRTGAFVETPYAPGDGTYIVRTSSDILTDEQSLANLSTGFVQVQTGTGLLSSTGNLTITTNDIGTLQVTTAKIDNLAVTTGKLDNDSVTNAKIADAQISLEHLDSGITPGYIIKYAANYTTTGGAASEDISISGVVASDIALATMRTIGAGSRTIQSTLTSTNKLTVVFSGDPSTDHVISYIILRAAS